LKGQAVENITYEEAMEQRTAMRQNLLDHPFYTAARAYCYRHGIESQEHFEQVLFSLAQKSFMEEAAPWFKVKADALALYPTTSYLQSDTGVLVAVPSELTGSTKELFREVDVVIENIAKRCGLRK
jgi:hypothetical protein